MISISAKDAGAETCRQAFGSLLTQQGRGYYVTLELLAIVWGTYNHNGDVLPGNLDELRYARRSHDFARRWMANDLTNRSAEEQFVTGADAPEILRALLESLRVPIPNRRKLPGWLGQHLYPYVGELIHYDAAPRGARNYRVSIEQYTYRGAGGLAHRILRSDDDASRLRANREGLTRLVEDSGGPLGGLAKACAAHDLGHDNNDSFNDERETKAVVDNTVWVDHLRNGVRNITSRALVRAKQIELLMHWVPYCVARHQLDRATEILGKPSISLPAALVQRSSPVRQAARRELDHARGCVDEALLAKARQLSVDVAVTSQADVYRRLVDSRTWRAPMLGFFTQTLATVGALNAHAGSRYLTLRLPLLEALVCASLEPRTELRFDDYCRDILRGEYGIIVGAHGDLAGGPMSRLDAAELTENADCLARDLAGLGLLSAYSDATRMVHGEVT